MELPHGTEGCKGRAAPHAEVRKARLPGLSPPCQKKQICKTSSASSLPSSRLLRCLKLLPPWRSWAAGSEDASPGQRHLPAQALLQALLVTDRQVLAEKAQGHVGTLGWARCRYATYRALHRFVLPGTGLLPIRRTRTSHGCLMLQMLLASIKVEPSKKLLSIFGETQPFKA